MTRATHLVKTGKQGLTLITDHKPIVFFLWLTSLVEDCCLLTLRKLNLREFTVFAGSAFHPCLLRFYLFYFFHLTLPTTIKRARFGHVSSSSKGHRRLAWVDLINYCFLVSWLDWLAASGSVSRTFRLRHELFSVKRSGGKRVNVW